MAFLVFEGIDASGKSTLLQLLCRQLQKKGLDFVQTKEPGGTEIGKKIREILLEKQNAFLDPLAETLLYYTDRKQHVKEIIQPAVKKNLWILSDRYWASTSAYQCGGRGIDESFVHQLRKTICSPCEPDLWILLDLPVEAALKRLYISKRNNRDRLEMENSDFYQRVRDYYLKLAQEESSKWLILTAKQSPEKLLEQLLSHLKQKNFFQKWKSGETLSNT